jgi:prevent-host-death family protein
MKVVGVRDLQQNASKVLKQVERGQSVEVTERRRPVALLVPIGRGDVLESLEAAGRLSRAEGDVLALGSPIGAPARAESAAARLARMRRHER